MINKVILLLFFSTLISLPTFGQQSPADSIASLQWIIGKWNVVATLEDSEGGLVEESGFEECSWVLGNRIIRCESYLRKAQAADSSKQFRSVISYIAYDKASNRFKVTWIRSNGNHTNVDFEKKDSETLYSEFIYNPPSLGMDMLIKNTHHNHFIALEILNSQESEFSERFELKAVRIE